nr:phospholipase-like protein [Tanacetum cinerariifolium]
DYLREEELKLCLEDEEMLRHEYEKLIVEGNRLRMDEETGHAKNILAKLAHAKRNQLGSFSEKLNSIVSWVKIKKYRQRVNDPCTAKPLQNIKPWVEDISRVFHSMNTVWFSDDIE